MLLSYRCYFYLSNRRRGSYGSYVNVGAHRQQHTGPVPAGPCSRLKLKLKRHSAARCGMQASTRPRWRTWQAEKRTPTALPSSLTSRSPYERLPAAWRSFLLDGRDRSRDRRDAWAGQVDCMGRTGGLLGRDRRTAWAGQADCLGGIGGLCKRDRRGRRGRPGFLGCCCSGSWSGCEPEEGRKERLVTLCAMTIPYARGCSSSAANVRRRLLNEILTNVR